MLIQSSFPTLRGRNAPGKNPNGSRRILIDEVLEGWDGFLQKDSLAAEASTRFLFPAKFGGD